MGLEGIVGSGKTTILDGLLPIVVANFPGTPVMAVREPGSSEIAEEIRGIFQRRRPVGSEKISLSCETTLVAAARAQLIDTIIVPTLEEGGIVLADRCYISSLAIQGIVEGFGTNRVSEINHSVVGACLPDKVFLLNVEINTAMGRLNDTERDRFETKGIKFWTQVAQAYLYLAQQLPGLIKEIDANRPIEAILKDICLELGLGKVEKLPGN